MTDYAVRGELNFNKENKKPKNIYWNYHEEKANIKWIDENTVLMVMNQVYLMKLLILDDNKKSFFI
ncbi:DUF5412 family protein [Solibacillus daqui]|uniref:DUF5412 family protein n=1 Tax=Solibacillus daqui TaxID=2912187 RepID=UPI003B75BA7A